MNFQVTVLKILVSYPEGFAVMADLKRDMAFLATSGRDWADRTKRLASRVPTLDIFSQGLVTRESGGWKITEKGRAVLELMEARPGADELLSAAPTETATVSVPPLPLAAERAKRRKERRERRREGRELAGPTPPERESPGLYCRLAQETSVRGSVDDCRRLPLADIHPCVADG